MDWDNLGFGLAKTDFMYLAKANQGSHFEKGEIVPYGPLSLEPAATIINYGQGLFEGLKAFRTEKGRVVIFRPDQNAERMREGAQRFLMQSELSAEVFIDGITKAVTSNGSYIPPCGKGALYLRPILFGSGGNLGVGPSTEYTFCVYVSPVGNYFKGAAKAIHLKAITDFHRAAHNGVGYVKAAGNYAPAFMSQKKAKEEGYSEALFLDSKEVKYLEEAGASNIFVVDKDGKTIRTPPLNGNILPGVTRRSIIQLARELGYDVLEEPVHIEQLIDAGEAFACGTGVSVTPVGAVTYLEKDYLINNKQAGPVSLQIQKTILDIQNERVPDTHNWLYDPFNPKLD
eukprot:TRINITY_DN2026_c0_g1_i1.p1 TRINITY_DN2026_c0_g1~~TRINITY_DN2026_c0_g1_i1.p1  ORF type:complete len:394 (+),score=106.53 TRINITY_DN2026_c0_g1_i1:156-1184(+)